MKAERAKVARMAREARRLQQEKDGKMQAWEEERQKFETAEAVSLARTIAAGGKKYIESTLVAELVYSIN